MNNEQTKNIFAFVLGRAKDLALLELKAVLARFDFCFSILSVTDNIAIIKFAKAVSCQLSAESLIDTLGGTVKIFKLCKISGLDLTKEISELILSEKKEAGSKVDFGISDYSNRSFDINHLGLEVKKRLKPDLKTRFIFVKEGRELSSIVSESNKLDGKGIELGVFNGYLGVLTAVSDPFAWSRRDYGKPQGDKYSGMLPPKLARALINITLSQENYKSPLDFARDKQITNSKQIPKSKKENSKYVCDLGFSACDFHDTVVVDPFCGSGNIAIEATILGCGVIASDISEKAVEDTRSNLDWISNVSGIRYKVSGKSNLNSLFEIRNTVFNADATKDDFLSPLETKNYKLATIVTEPYLGEPKKYKPSKSAVRGEFSKLKETYLGFLGNLAGLLETKNYKLETICLIFPLVESSDGGRISLWRESVDEIQNLGYTLLRPPLTYGREYQVVKRQIVFLTK